MEIVKSRHVQTLCARNARISRQIKLNLCMLLFIVCIKWGGGVQAYNFGNFNYELRVEGEGQDTSRLFRVVLDVRRPYTQFYPCEASNQKWGQTPK